jgi:hypothetical protein
MIFRQISGLVFMVGLGVVGVAEAKRNHHHTCAPLICPKVEQAAGVQCTEVRRKKVNGCAMCPGFQCQAVPSQAGARPGDYKVQISRTEPATKRLDEPSWDHATKNVQKGTSGTDQPKTGVLVAAPPMCPSVMCVEPPVNCHYVKIEAKKNTGNACDVSCGEMECAPPPQPIANDGSVGTDEPKHYYIDDSQMYKKAVLPKLPPERKPVDYLGGPVRDPNRKYPVDRLPADENPGGVKIEDTDPNHGVKYEVPVDRYPVDRYPLDPLPPQRK